MSVCCFGLARRTVARVTVVGLLSLVFAPGFASAAYIVGTFEPITPLGQFMSLRMTINDTTTTLEMTGPEKQWYAFGFTRSAATMDAYALIVNGQDDGRFVTEHSMICCNPGAPLLPQYANIVSQTFDSVAGLSTVVVERPSVLGLEPTRTDFLTSWTEVEVLWAYDSLDFGDLDYHGFDGRARGVLTFTFVPEPASLGIALLALVAGLLGARGRRAVKTS